MALEVQGVQEEWKMKSECLVVNFGVRTGVKLLGGEGEGEDVGEVGEALERYIDLWRSYVGVDDSVQNGVNAGCKESSGQALR